MSFAGMTTAFNDCSLFVCLFVFIPSYYYYSWQLANFRQTNLTWTNLSSVLSPKYAVFREIKCNLKAKQSCFEQFFLYHASGLCFKL